MKKKLTSSFEFHSKKVNSVLYKPQGQSLHGMNLYIPNDAFNDTNNPPKTIVITVDMET